MGPTGYWWCKFHHHHSNRLKMPKYRPCNQSQLKKKKKKMSEIIHNFTFSSGSDNKCINSCPRSHNRWFNNGRMQPSTREPSEVEEIINLFINAMGSATWLRNSNILFHHLKFIIKNVNFIIMQIFYLLLTALRWWTVFIFLSVAFSLSGWGSTYPVKKNVLPSLSDSVTTVLNRRCKVRRGTQTIGFHHRRFSVSPSPTLSSSPVTFSPSFVCFPRRQITKWNRVKPQHRHWTTLSHPPEPKSDTFRP